MITNSSEAEQHFLHNIGTLTGWSLRQWMYEISKNTFRDKRELACWLKIKYRLRHLHACLMAGIFFNDGKPVYTNINH